MKFDRDFLTSGTGQVVLVTAVLLVGAWLVRRPQGLRPAPNLPPAKPAPAVPLPKVMKRDVARFMKPAPATVLTVPAPDLPPPPPKLPVRELPLAVFNAATSPGDSAPAPYAPSGRLIPCETVIALESNRLETPIIGLVTENVWHAGQIVVPAGAEVHGRAVLDRARERLAAQSAWRIVWRTNDRDNGLELATDGIVLEREFDGAGGQWGEHDGSAGLRGQLIRSDNDHELRLFAATFLGTATAALQDTRAAAGLFGETSFPIASARNAVLAGTAAILREEAQQLKEAIARDGFYLRVPSGHAFYLYTTVPLDRSQARRAGTHTDKSNHR
jgi:hypothetical protein